jgi:hypothetical protein
MLLEGFSPLRRVDMGNLTKQLCRTAAVIGLVFGTSGRAQADLITAYDVTVSTGNQSYGGPLGMDFDVNQAIVITELGVFDSGQDGLKSAINARIYDRDDPTAPLRSIEFAAGDSAASGTLEGMSRFLPIAPLVLPAGFHGSIVADGYTSEVFFNQYYMPSVSPSILNSGGGLISFVGTSRYGGAPGTYPTILDVGANGEHIVNEYAAGTFKFTAVSVPEPSTAALAALGGLAFLLDARRRTAIPR